jgi:predicted RNA-binding Zn-ribbon protein involved in translation (DUF1610 family)
MDRKYKQKGYQDGGSGEQQQPAKPKPPKDREGPKSPNMMAFQGVIRCTMCGARVELVDISLESTCPNCRSDLRTCRNCINFDPGARFECRVNPPKRVSNKTVRTECELFTPKQTVEKMTGETRGPAKPDDPRAAFDRLFKK